MLVAAYYSFYAIVFLGVVVGALWLWRTRPQEGGPPPAAGASPDRVAPPEDAPGQAGPASGNR